MNTDNPFELFGLNVQLNICHAVLDRAFQRIQMLCHPDQYTCPINKQAALTLSAKISTQYAALKTSIGCLNAILKLHNLDNIDDIAKTHNDIITMQEIFSMQEDLITLKTQNNTVGIQQLNDTVKERITDIESAFILAHEHQNLADLQKYAVRFSYFIKFQKNILEPELGI